MLRRPVCAIEDLPPGSMKLVQAGKFGVGVYNCGGELYAIEDRCSHDDGPLVEGEFDQATCTVECPRHGSRFDVKTGKALCAPAETNLQVFEVKVEGEDLLLKV